MKIILGGRNFVLHLWRNQTWWSRCQHCLLHYSKRMRQVVNKEDFWDSWYWELWRIPEVVIFGKKWKRGESEIVYRTVGKQFFCVLMWCPHHDITKVRIKVCSYGHDTYHDHWLQLSANTKSVSPNTPNKKILFSDDKVAIMIVSSEISKRWNYDQLYPDQSGKTTWR